MSNFWACYSWKCMNVSKFDLMWLHWNSIQSFFSFTIFLIWLLKEDCIFFLRVIHFSVSVVSESHKREVKMFKSLYEVFNWILPFLKCKFRRFSVVYLFILDAFHLWCLCNVLFDMTIILITVSLFWVQLRQIHSLVLWYSYSNRLQ